MVCMTEHQMCQRIVALIDKHSPRPTELLQLANDLPYAVIQDVIAELLDSGQIELDADRRLRTRRAAA
jgi:predicted transcriptional regulator